MSITQSHLGIPTGTWDIDVSHSSANFSARHLMVSKVRGRFASFTGNITIADDPFASSVNVTLDASSIDTQDEKRDEHLKSADFLDVDNYPTLTFASTAVRSVGDEDYELDGDITIRGNTRPVTLKLAHLGVQQDPWGNTRTGFEASTEISRKDFGLEWNVALEGGGVLVGDKVKIDLEVEAVHQDPKAQ
jgi:polyisoprenoid-binding protein YceI